ncbi:MULTISPECIES: autotransporter outer membrane beta-barrel domain-containing protein [Citrobacter]|uniref:autotransporter outer membrane beta-barrel domain-containing protein n=1 Tax=Citrobacter TaxID=544 RepID=UPI001908B66E|nr:MULTISPECIES: autotransporter outer membrane beta-barrel domain-containing protein [Citrobacter]MBJ9863682.1 autotransporter outer membrane beta-barrel domain-containing protein [Citrobacter amalonaticus]MDU7776125.1 autotransporter outer membrane beta-barrel domain-containing protein [Citrobacter sp.]
MNTNYRVIWNEVLKVFQVCSELVRGKSQSSTHSSLKTTSSSAQQHHALQPLFKRSALSLLLLASLPAYSAIIDNGEVVNVATGYSLDYYTFIGMNGVGTLNILAGGVVAGSDVYKLIIGDNTQANGTVNVDGSGSSLRSGAMTIAEYGVGTMTISNAAVVNTSGLGVLGGSNGSHGSVTIRSGGLWNLVNPSGALQDLNIGYGGTGVINIEEGGALNAGMTTIGSFEAGVGTVSVSGQNSTMSTGALRVGDYGSGTLNISDSAIVRSSADSMLGRSPAGYGRVNISNGGEWRIADASDVTKKLNVGHSATGILDIQSGGKVVASAVSLAANGGEGTVNINGAGSRLDATSATVGAVGDGTLNLSNSGALNLNGKLFIAQNASSTGVVNIGAAQGQAAAGAGVISGVTGVTFGSGIGSLVLNHTTNDPSTAGGYQLAMPITGQGTIVHQAGHTVLTGDNTYSGKTLVNGGTLTSALQSSANRTGLGSSEVTIGSDGTLEIVGATDTSTNDFAFSNVLNGTGLMSVNLYAGDDVFSFTPAVGNSFRGAVELRNSTFALSGTNASSLAQSLLISSAGNTTTVSGTQDLTGLLFNGGTLAFDVTLPGSTISNSLVSVNTLVAGAAGVMYNGREHQADGTGTVKVNLADPWNDTGAAANPDTTANLLQQDDAGIGVQLVKASIVLGSGGSLTLADQNGAPIAGDKTLQIAQNGTTVANGQYGFRLTTAPGNGLYVNYGLKALDILSGQTLVLSPYAGATGAGADMSATISGSGNLAVNTADVVSLSNGLNDYSGATQVQAGTLRTDADGALGETSELHISSGGTADLNGTTQTAGTLTGQSNSTLALNGGSLTLSNGGLSEGSLTGSGALNVNGGLLTIDGANAALTAKTTISSGAEVSVNDVLGAGSGDIVDGGTLTLNGVVGTLTNTLSGAGGIDVANMSDVVVSGDNSGFSGLFNIDTDNKLTVSEQQNLGTASVTDNGLLTVATDTDWTLDNAISGTGDLTKTGSGVLTLKQDLTSWTGTTDILDGEIALGSDVDSAVDMANQQVNIHDGATLSGYGRTAGDVDVMSGGTMQVSDFTVGGNLTHSGTVILGRSGMQPGNHLDVNGNYHGNDGLMVFNTALGGDDSATDKLTVHGDTSGNTRVDVNNVGGIGAQTRNGIELVQVEGNSAGQFALTRGSVEAGAYVYTLAKGTGEAAKNWYLTSKWNGVIDSDNPPVVDPRTVDVLRPEAGSYTSNISAANTLFAHRLHDRLGEPQYNNALQDEGLAGSMWMRHVGGHERSSAGDGQLKTQSNRYVLQLGGDIAQWSMDGLDRWHLGVMGGYANEHSNTQSNRAGYGSDGRTSGYSAGLYGTWYQNAVDNTGAYVDSWLLYNWFDNTVDADERESDSYDSKGLTASLEAGYTLKAGTFSGSQGSLNTWYIQPQAQVTWMGVKSDSHTRHDGTRIETEGDGNIQTRLGVKTYLNSHHKMDDGQQREFQPYVEVNWIHNTESFGVKMDGVKISRDGARNLGEVRTGVEGKLNNRLSVWGNVGVQLGDKGYSDTQGMLGVKYSW